MRAHLAAWHAYPLLITGLLAAGSFWLEHLTREEETPLTAPERRAPDFAATEVSIDGFAADGSLRYTLDTPRIIHVPQNDQTLTTQPQLQLFSHGKRTWLHAEHGIISAGGEHADFNGEVKIERGNDSDDAQVLHFFSDHLTVWPKDQRAATDTPVRLTQGSATATALGLAASNIFGNLELVGEVKMSLPRHRRNP
jgi:lipopolysaccharide export system protein LptC